MRMIRCVLICSIFVPAGVALAWDGAVAGRVLIADVTDGPNYTFRITLQGVPALCGNTTTWAYVDRGNTSYESYVAILLSAKALGDQVTVYSTRDATGYCRIGYVSAQSS